jgi:transposase
MSDYTTAFRDRFGAADPRGLTAQLRVELRREVVAAVRGGMAQIEASRRFGVSRRTVGNWVRAAEESRLSS